MTTNEKHIKQRGEIEFVRLGQISVPSWAQRKLRPHRVDELVSQFNLDDFGIPVVSERRGVFLLRRWSAQNRSHQAVDRRQVGRPAHRVPCAAQSLGAR